MLKINLTNKEVTRTELPSSLKGLAQESLNDLNWADSFYEVNNFGWWVEKNESSIPTEFQKYSGNETYRVDEANKIIYVTKEIVSLTSDELVHIRAEKREERNRLLLETDWWGLAENSDSYSDARKKYRQDLRDLTSLSGFPNIDFPTKPE